MIDVIPAIDLRGGKCVRLYQGNYSHETVYSESPVDVAARWVSQGARRIHVVDLDGAKQGTPVNLNLVSKIISSIQIPIQLGGGIRTVEMARTVLDMGVDRVMVGTTAVENTKEVRSMCDELSPDSVVVSVDARDGYVARDGWTLVSNVLASDLVKRMSDVGAMRFMYTDISRDGTLTEPNFEAIEMLLRQKGLRILVAGGVSSVEHLKRLDHMGVEGVVVGKALYTGDIDLSQAIKKLGRNVG